MPEISERLRRAGLDAVVVRLDHDPGVTEIMPYLVNVVTYD